MVTGGSLSDGTRYHGQERVWTTIPSAALVWATGNYYLPDTGGDSERSASQSVCAYVYGLFDGLDRYSYCRNSWGTTQPYNVYGNVSYCENNHANTAIFYKGHINPRDWDCGVQGCGFNHSSIYDYEGWDYTYDQIIDYHIHEDDNGYSRLSSKTHDFVFLWACDWGNENRTGGFSGSHSWGMQASWMGVNDLQYDGYKDPDYRDRCFISFWNASIMFTNQTGYSGKTYSDWTKLFFEYALQDDYTIQIALDQATRDTHGPNVPFSDCKLYKGYTMIVNGQEWDCSMVVYGDGYHEMAR